MKLDLAATKSNLFSVKETLSMAVEGHELLSQKREVLLAELLHLLNDVKRVKEEADSAIAEAYACFRLVITETGQDGAFRLSQACRALADVSMQERSVMGVPIPLIEVHLPAKQPSWSLGETPVIVDEMVERFRHALTLLSEQAEIETSVLRLGRELAKTQLRTNALEHLVIPQHQETAKFIQETMEEREREAHFQLKRIKSGFR